MEDRRIFWALKFSIPGFFWVGGGGGGLENLASIFLGGGLEGLGFKIFNAWDFGGLYS